MEKPVSPLWSVAIYTPIVALVLWALKGHDFALTLPRVAGLGFMAVLWMVGFVLFGGRFVRPRWKIYGKAAMTLTIAYLAMIWLGPWGLLIPVFQQLVGLTAHVVICRRHNIDWRTCEPRADYIALQEKWARGDFS